MVSMVWGEKFSLVSLVTPGTLCTWCHQVHFYTSDTKITFSPMEIGQGGKPMGSFTAIVKKDGEWWIGWIEEVPGVNAQEKTKDELLVSLKEALRDILELRREETMQYKGIERIKLAA